MLSMLSLIFTGCTFDWNFFQSGHGKGNTIFVLRSGLYDGEGARLKFEARTHVIRDGDIPDAHALFEFAKTMCRAHKGNKLNSIAQRFAHFKSDSTIFRSNNHFSVQTVIEGIRSRFFFISTAVEGRISYCAYPCDKCVTTVCSHVATLESGVITRSDPHGDDPHPLQTSPRETQIIELSRGSASDVYQTFNELYDLNRQWSVDRVRLALRSGPDNDVDEVDEYDDDDQRVCYSGIEYDGTRCIQCEGLECKIGWFHTICVGINDAAIPPVGGWNCPNCLGASVVPKCKKAKKRKKNEITRMLNYFFMR